MVRILVQEWENKYKRLLNIFKDIHFLTDKPYEGSWSLKVVLRIARYLSTL